MNIIEIENENNIEFSYEIKLRNNKTRQIQEVGIYIDKNQLNLIKEVHAMTYENFLNNIGNTGKIAICSYYWLASTNGSLPRICSNRRNA